MKINDFTYIFDRAMSIITVGQFYIADAMHHDQLAQIVTNAYWMADLCKEVTARVHGFGTMIITRNSMSIILDDGEASHSKNDGDQPYVEYEDLDFDLTSLLANLDWTYLRIVT